MTFKEAIEREKAGEYGGFDFLYKETVVDMTSIALSYMKNAHDVEDVLQELYLKAMRSLDKLEDPDKFPNWLSVIVKNTAKDALKKIHTVSYDGIVYEAEAGYEYYFEVVDEDIKNDPEYIVEMKESEVNAERILSKLPEEQKQCMKMHYFDGLTTKEIAEELGVKEATIRSRLMYARRKLKRMYWEDHNGRET